MSGLPDPGKVLQGVGGDFEVAEKSVRSGHIRMDILAGETGFRVFLGTRQGGHLWRVGSSVHQALAHV